MHAIIHGVFLGIITKLETKPDGVEFLVAYSRIQIVSYETLDGSRVAFECPSTAEVDGATTEAKRMKAAAPQHLFIDTESAAPFDHRVTGKRHGAFPILQYSFVRTDASFVTRIASGTEFVRYPHEHAASLGNDDRSSVLKVSLDLLETGIDVHRALEVLFSQLRRVADTGGCVVAHNVRHDLAQLCKTAQLVQYDYSPPLTLRTLDTVKTSSNFVPGCSDVRWMKLCELATLCNATPIGALHDAETDVRLLWDIVRTHFPYDERLDACVEVVTL